MKRDFDLIRKILLAIESDAHISAGNFAIEGYSDEQVGYHTHLLWDAGWIDAFSSSTIGIAHKHATPLDLTWTGHEFIDAISSDTVWEKTKKFILSSGTGITLGVLQKWIEDLGSDALRLSFP